MEYSASISIKAVDAAAGPIKKIQARMAAMLAPVRRLQDRLKKLGDSSGITRLGRSIGGLYAPLRRVFRETSRLVGKLGLLGGGMLGGAVAGFRSLFVNVAAQNEALTRSMVNVTGSADGARAALAGVQASLRGWNAEEAANAYMILRRAGLGAGEEDLKKLADIAGHTGRSLTDVAGIMAGLRDGNTGGLDELLGGNVRKIGDHIVAEFTDAEGKLRRMAVKQTGDAAKDARALQQLMNRAVDVKGMAGGAERFGQSWQGMVQRAFSAWHRFRSLVMDSGPFALLKQKFAGVLETLEELEANGGLQALAEEWAQKFCDAIERLWEAGKSLVQWFRGDFLPALESVKKFFGGWGNMLKAIAAMFAGPLVVALAAATKAVIALGAAMLATPVGWIIAGVAAVAGSVYLIYKNWTKITDFFKDLWGQVTGLFTGFSLKDAGVNIVNSLWGGLKSKWDGLVSWLKGAWQSLTGWLPDSIKGRLGIRVEQSRSGGAGNEPGGPPTGAAAVMAGGAAAAPGRLPEQRVRTEVVITGENLPPGISVSAPKSQADRTRLNCGYMMAGT